jgi:hypothetical protein
MVFRRQEEGCAHSDIPQARSTLAGIGAIGT